MDSLSFNRNAQKISNNSSKVSFTGQKSVIDAYGTQQYRFYVPPYDETKYFAALELVSVKEDKDSRGRNTGDFKTEGKPVLIPESIKFFDGSSNGMKNLSYEVSSDELKRYQLDNDIVGYRFVLLDKKTYNDTHNIEEAIEAAKLTDKDGNRHINYLVDSGNTASAAYNDNYSYFSKKQGFVNKIGPMYHIMPDAYNVDGEDDGNEDFVRTPFNKAGGNIQGMIKKLKEEKGELSPYEMIITTPLFGGDDVSSHGYWTANPFQISSTKGTLEDFKDFQAAVFDAGKSYVTDGAFTSFGLEAPQLQHVLKWGKESPFYNWIKFDDTDDPNGRVKLGVLPDTIIPPDNKDAKPEEYKKSQTLLENIRFKVVNPKYIESDANDRFSKPKANPDYDETKPTYIQFYDDRLAGSEADDLTSLITKYEKQNTENHYDITTHQDSVQPFYFEVDPSDPRFQTRGASLKELQEEGYVANYDKLKKPVIKKGYDTFFQMPHFAITTKSQSGGSTAWDGQVDLFKANISNPSSDTANVTGNKQVKNYYYNIASYWTKLTDDALLEHIAKNVGQNGNNALKEIGKKHKISNAEINSLSHIIKTEEFEKNFNKKFAGKSDEEILLGAITDFPLESVEFAPDLTAVLSMPEITPRPYGKNADEKASNLKLLKTMSSGAQSLYADSMQNYVTSVLSKLDSKMPAGQKIFNKGNVTKLTDYGKFVADIVTADIMKYGVVKALFPDDDLVEFDSEGKAEYDEELKYKGLAGLGINEPNKPENEANVLLEMLADGFDDIKNEDNSDLVNALYTRFKNVDLDDIKTARAVINRTGAGLNWRFDAAKDVADLDKRRENDPRVTFEKCWDDVIDFWGGFIQNIRKYNPASYTVAEVTNLWEFSSIQSGNKNAFAAKTGKTPEEMQREDFGKYINPQIAERMLYEKTGATTGSNYEVFYALYPELFGQNFEFGTVNDYRLYNMEAFENGLKDFFKSNSPQFINQSHIFVNNHDKPRPLHCMALDMELFLSDLQNHDDDSKKRVEKNADFKNRAKTVTKIADDNKLDTVSSMAVAVGEKYLKMFEESYSGILSKQELETVKQAIADLSAGKFLNQTQGNMEKSRAFGYLPFDITLKDVIQQARYLSETKGMSWSISSGKKSNDKELSQKETKLYNETFSKLAPDTEKLSAMLRMMMFSVGIPTLFAGDEMAHSGYETPTKNVELAIRNIIHHSWLDDSAEGKEFVKELYNHTTAAANVHKMKGLSALADGSPLVVPQENSGDNSHTALFKYNDKGSNVLVVYSNKQMDTKDRNPMAKLNTDEVDKISHIDLEYIDPYGKSAGRVARDGDKYKKLEYNPSTAEYEPGKETYVVRNGKLVREGMATSRGISSPSVIELDDVANVFYKVA